MDTVRKAILPVAGMGTRLLPITKAIPKEMLPIIDKPLIQYAVEEAISSGITEIIFIIGSHGQIVKNYFGSDIQLQKNLIKIGKHHLIKLIQNVMPMHINCKYVFQEFPLGLGHAILLAEEEIGNNPFAVLLVDDLIDSDPHPPVLKQLINIAISKKTNVIGIEEIMPIHTNRYGIVSINKTNQQAEKIINIIEKPDIKDSPSNLAIVGRYIFNPKIFSHLQNVKPGVNNEIQLTDGIVSLINEQDVYAYRYNGSRYDCGDINGLFQATISYGMKYHGLLNKI
ncbi:MAG: UTP--glucose-1-phosphate uridylyltransferase [Bordetella sp.]|nr:MAG: UTP--glucose-1-phosphate uridylyltransferase [Bordetella sp.]